MVLEENQTPDCLLRSSLTSTFRLSHTTAFMPRSSSHPCQHTCLPRHYRGCRRRHQADLPGPPRPVPGLLGEHRDPRLGERALRYGHLPGPGRLGRPHRSSASARPGPARRRHVPAARLCGGLDRRRADLLHHGPPNRRPPANHLAEVSVRKSPASRLLGSDAGRREACRAVHISGR